MGFVSRASGAMSRRSVFQLNSFCSFHFDQRSESFLGTKFPGFSFSTNFFWQLSSFGIAAVALLDKWLRTRRFWILCHLAMGCHGSGLEDGWRSRKWGKFGGKFRACRLVHQNLSKSFGQVDSISASRRGVFGRTARSEWILRMPEYCHACQGLSRYQRDTLPLNMQ